MFPKIGGNTPKWTVKIMENLIKMDDLGGKPTIFGNIQILKGKTPRDVNIWVASTSDCLKAERHGPSETSTDVECLEEISLRRSRRMNFRVNESLQNQ